MTSLLNPDRPPFFCPGCSHESVVKALDKSFQHLGLSGDRIAIVTDIGCSGLFDTFFNTHALHGLHGRALTYATGLKLACPELTVVVIMGDGGLGIGGAHVLSSCRRNLDLCLLVLNNFNYAMTGGQCSATTPVEASTSSGFLGQLEAPLDICAVAEAAGASWIDRLPATSSDLPEKIFQAISYDGFSLMDITGICPGRFSKRNRQASKLITELSERFDKSRRTHSPNSPPEFGEGYRKRSKAASPPPPLRPIVCRSKPEHSKKMQILLLGAAGQRVNTAAEILCLAAMHGGLYATQKNDYPITVLRGHSISEVILSSEPIDFTGIEAPDIILALSDEGVVRREITILHAQPSGLIVKEAGVVLPDTAAQVVEFDTKVLSVPRSQGALAAVALLVQHQSLVDMDLLRLGLMHRFTGEQLEKTMGLVEHVASSTYG
ncbi:MAG: 2-oxoacid:acceptor oxidoreductase family protein [Desulfofustis sp.]|nr:2-oxoacid:acceptor oxidoreductase family protein [Desulfofustis sp.]